VWPRYYDEECRFYCESVGVETIASLEARMACGFGACVGCVVETINGLKKVCVDGPVFRAEDVWA